MGGFSGAFEPARVPESRLEACDKEKSENEKRRPSIASRAESVGADLKWLVLSHITGLTSTRRPRAG